MTSAETIETLLDEREGLRCLPSYTKKWLAGQLKDRPRSWLDRYRDQRIGFLQHFIEPLSRHPDVPLEDPALQRLDKADFVVTIPQRVRQRGAGVFRDPRDFALCCTELAPLRTTRELGLSLGMDPPEQMQVNTWLDWAIELQQSQDFVSALYCLASFWAMPKTREDLHGEWLRIESDAICSTAMALMAMLGPAAALDVFEHWSECSLRNHQTSTQLRQSLRSSVFSRIDDEDTAAQLVSKMMIALLAWEDPEASRALALLEAWLDVSFSQDQDRDQLAQRLRESIVHRVRSSRLVQHLRSQMSEVIEKAVGPRAVAKFQDAWLRSFLHVPPLELPVAPSADFSPVLLQLHLAAPAGDQQANKEEMASAFFHEYLHFLQSIGTTYNQDRLLDVMNLAAAAVKALGGDVTRMIHGASKIDHDFVEHLRFHRNTLDGDYPSHAVSQYYGDESVGVIEMNEETQCFEYIRYHNYERTFFATPLGAHAFQEALVFANQQFANLAFWGSNASIIPPLETEPVCSAMHVYTAPFDLFFRAFEDQPATAVQKVATLAAVLDLSLHLPDLPIDAPESWRMDTIPTFRFRHLFEAVHDVDFADPNVDHDYERFVDELCDLLGWNSLTDELRRRADKLAAIRDDFNQSIRAYISERPEALEALVQARLRGVEQSLRTRGTSEAKIQRELTDLERALRGNPAVHLGVFGLGIIDYFERALRLRLTDPWDVILPSRNLEKTLQELPIPAWFVGDQLHGAYNERSLSMLEDMNNLRHLYAVGVQWELAKSGDRLSRDYMCGFQFLGMPCPDPRCASSGCPLWRPGMTRPDAMCSFLDTLRARDLLET